MEEKFILNINGRENFIVTAVQDVDDDTNIFLDCGQLLELSKDNSSKFIKVPLPLGNLKEQYLDKRKQLYSRFYLKSLPTNKEDRDLIYENELRLHMLPNARNKTIIGNITKLLEKEGLISDEEYNSIADQMQTGNKFANINGGRRNLKSKQSKKHNRNRNRKSKSTRRRRI